MDFKNITLVAVAGTKVLETIDAMRKCHEQAHFEHTLLLSPKLDYKQYNEFVVMELWKYINTDYCLLFQNDGCIVDGSKWTDEFLNYDYIGAPWPLPQDNYSYRPPKGELVRVGNSVSLRSRKILELPSQLGLEWKSYFGNTNEDGFLCVHNRDILKENGVKFAPFEVALQFSKEAELVENKELKTFAFHTHG